MRALWLALVAALTLAAPAAAHRGHSSLSVVEIDAATGAVTVIHRMAAHDVEPFLVRLAPDAAPSLDDAEAMAALRRHGAEAFQLWNGDGAPAELSFLSEELSGDDVRLVYRGRLTGPTATVRVDSDLLRDTHADQENQVNVRRGGVTRTLVFRPSSGPQSVSFVD